MIVENSTEMYVRSRDRDSKINHTTFYHCFKKSPETEQWTPTRIVTEHFPDAFKTKDELQVKLLNSSIMEYQENYFSEKNLINSNYSKFQTGDFASYDEFLRKEYTKLKLRGNGKFYPTYRKILMKETIHGSKRLPLLLHGSNDISWLLFGESQMLSFRVLGISPLVKQIDIDAEIH